MRTPLASVAAFGGCLCALAICASCDVSRVRVGEQRCRTFLDCADDQRCDGSAAEQESGDGACVALENSCDEDGSCGDGLVCNVVDCRRVCEPPGVRGVTCLRDGDELFCEPPLSSPTQRACADGLTCDVLNFGFTSDGRCLPPSGRVLFEQCQSSDVCGDGLSCDVANAQCRTTLGGACSEDFECVSAVCTDKRCAP